jgi:hypothetical protein
VEIAVLALVAVARVDPVLILQMLMRGRKLGAEAEDSLRRVQAIGPDASKESENESADELSHGTTSGRGATFG